jgi:hypothetical protein
MPGPLGCGEYQVRVYDRMTGALIANADTLIECVWTRILDDFSEARALVQPDTTDCCGALANLSAWRHKLVIYRNGGPVWEGPITIAQWTTDSQVEIRAVDILGWLDRRVPHEDMTFTGIDLAVIAETLINDAFAPDDPGHSVEILAPTRIRGNREYEEDDGQTGDHLRDLAETGLDYTAVGSTIVLMPEDFCGLVGSLTDADFPNGLAVVEDGLALATRWVVHGKDEVVGTAGGIDPYYGLLERSVEETSILDNASAGAAARSRLAASNPAPVVIDSQQTTLSPEAPVDLATLVPGWCVNVATTTTCRRVAQDMKIIGVSVQYVPAGERVTVQLTPSGGGATTGAGTEG